MSIEYVQAFIGMDGKVRVVVDPADPDTLERAAEALHQHAQSFSGLMSDFDWFTAGAAAVLASLSQPTEGTPT